MYQKTRQHNRVIRRPKQLHEQEAGDRRLKRLRSNDATLEAITSETSGKARLTPETVADTPSLGPKSPHKYEKLLAVYMHQGISQLSTLIIRRLISEAVVPAPRHKESLVKLLSATAQDLLLSELEIVVWAIYLDKFVWRDFSMPLETLMLYSAFAVKTYMNEDTSVLKLRMSSRYPHFTARYNQWISKHRSRMGIPPKELNDKFKQLSKPLVSQDAVKLIDYNYYVDEILQISPPFSSVQGQTSTQEREPDKEGLEREVQYCSDDHAFSPVFRRRNSTHEYDSPSLFKTMSVESLGMISPTFETIESVSDFSPFFSRPNSGSYRQMQLIQDDSKDDGPALPTMNKHSSFVSSLINSDFP